MTTTNYLVRLFTDKQQWRLFWSFSSMSSMNLKMGISMIELSIIEHFILMKISHMHIAVIVQKLCHLLANGSY